MNSFTDSLELAANKVDVIKRSGECIQTQHAHGQITWHRFGSGDPLVLVHGGVGSWLHWINNIAALSQHRQLLLPDIPGLGQSDELQHPVTENELGSVIAQGIQALTANDQRVDLAAFSFGGIVATHAAVKLGHLARSLVLVGASGTGLPREPMQLKRRTPDMTIEQRFECHDYNLRALMLSPDYPIDAMARYIHDQNDRTARLRSRKISMTDSLAKAIFKVEAKIAGIWGEKDITAAPWIAQRRDLLRSVQPDAPFTIIDAGHWVQYEAADEFNQSLTDTLAQLSTTT